METHLTIKRLAPYLLYGLKVQGQTHKEIFELGGLDGSVALLVGAGRVDLFDIKPILRPLSDLTNEIIINKKKFVPASKMITHGFHNNFWYEKETFDYRYLYVMDLEKLFEWHFNVFKLPENLFVNYNDVSK